MTPITAPSIKQDLHALVDTLPESEVETARRVLTGLHAIGSAPSYTLDNATEDDEPETEEERAAVAEALADVAAGRVYTHEQVKRELGLA
jgi:predicted transcriptional regulator